MRSVSITLSHSNYNYHAHARSRALYAPPRREAIIHRREQQTRTAWRAVRLISEGARCSHQSTLY